MGRQINVGSEKNRNFQPICRRYIMEIVPDRLMVTMEP